MKTVSITSLCLLCLLCPKLQALDGIGIDQAQAMLDAWNAAGANEVVTTAMVAGAEQQFRLSLNDEGQVQAEAVVNDPGISGIELAGDFLVDPPQITAMRVATTAGTAIQLTDDGSGNFAGRGFVIPRAQVESLAANAVATGYGAAGSGALVINGAPVSVNMELTSDGRITGFVPDGVVPVKWVMIATEGEPPAQRMSYAITFDPAGDYVVEIASPDGGEPILAQDEARVNDEFALPDAIYPTGIPDPTMWWPEDEWNPGAAPAALGQVPSANS